MKALYLKYTKPAFQDIECLHNNSRGFFGKHIATRISYLALVPYSVIMGVADGAITIAAGIASHLTLRRCKVMKEIYDDHIKYFMKSLPKIYIILLKAIQPNASIHKNIDSIFKNYISTFLEKNLTSLNESNNFFKKHVVSRFIIFPLYVFFSVECIAKSAIGIIAATLSFITLGKIKLINDCAYSRLHLVALLVLVPIAFVENFINPCS